MSRSFPRPFFIAVAFVTIALSTAVTCLPVKEAKAAPSTINVAASVTPSTTCQVTYQMNPILMGSFSGNVVIYNHNPTSAINGWRATITLSPGQKITMIWHALLVSQSGTQVWVTGSPYYGNGNISPGGLTNFGIEGTYSGRTFSPPPIVIDGIVHCTVVVQSSVEDRD